MISVFLTVLEQMLRILLFLALGFSLNRLHILPKGVGGGISKLVTMVFLPALLIHTNMTEFNLANVAAYGQIVLTGGVFFLAVVLLSHPLARKMAGGNRQDEGIYLYGLSFPNTGAVGMPLALSLLGTAGLFQFNLFLLTSSIMTYLWGIGLFLPGEKKNTPKRFLKNLANPICVSMLIGLLLGALGANVWMPALVTNFVKELSACYVPVSLIMAGYSIADYPLNEVFNRPKAYWFSLVRLIAIPLLVIFVSKGVGLSKFLAILAVLDFAGPGGMNTVVFPASYGQDCRTGASIVLLSSLGSVVTVPLLYTLVQYLFG